MKIINGINTDKLNEKLLQVAEVLKPLNVNIECDDSVTAELATYPKGARIKKLYVALSFFEELADK